MKYHQSTCRMLCGFLVLVALSETAAHGDIYDPYGLQYHYKPWGAWGPEFTAPNIPRMANILQGRESLTPRVAIRADSSQKIYDELNLSVKMLGAAWTEFDPKA